MSHDSDSIEDIDREIYYLSSVKRDNVVKVSFNSNYTYKHSNKKNLRIKICIGSLVAKELQWKDGDAIHIEGNDKLLTLSKIEPSDQIESEYRTFKGYKLTKIRMSYSFAVSASFTPTKNLEWDKIRIVPHKIINKSVLTNNSKFLKIYLQKE